MSSALWGLKKARAMLDSQAQMHREVVNGANGLAAATRHIARVRAIQATPQFYDATVKSVGVGPNA